MSLHYFGYYTAKKNPNDFREFPGCNIKMSYIIDSIKKNNIPITVVCLGESKKKKKKKLIQIDSLETNVFVGTTPNKYLSKLFLYFQICYYLVTKVQKEDTVIFYHTLQLLPFFKTLRVLRGFNLIIEVEESYMAAWNKPDILIKLEVLLLKKADAYIYVNDILPSLIERDKPYVICYGAYEQYNIPNKQTDNYKIVYAGLISETMNSDIYLAIDSLNYLDERYTLKILGYGTELAIKNMKDYITSKNLKHRIKYEGFLRGSHYIELLQTCRIAINPRVLEDNLSNYTFPSKVLTYLSCGLYVVTTPISCINKSSISHCVQTSIDNTPKEFANAIKRLNKNNANNNIIKKLNVNFIEKIESLLKPPHKLNR